MINDQKYFLKLIKLLEYIPDSWNLDIISKKPVYELSSSEWKLLNRVAKEKKLATEIKYYLSGTIFNDFILEETMKIDLKKLIDEKFGLDLVQKECDKYLNEYKTYEASIEVLEKKDRNAFYEAVLYLLENSRKVVPVKNKSRTIFYRF